MLACCLLGSLLAVCSVGCYVLCGCIGSYVFSFRVVGAVRCLSTCSLQSVTAFCFGPVGSCLVSFFLWLLPASSCSSERASVLVYPSLSAG